QRPGEAFGLPTHACNGSCKRLSRRVRESELFRGKIADEGAAAHAGNTVITWFFREEIHNRESVPQRDSCFVECLRDLQASQHACNAIKAASTGNRVRVRAEHDGAGTRF